MKIYLMRHGIAVKPEGFEFQDDSLRPLTVEGRNKIKDIARGLRKLDIKPDLILSSPFARAKQTASILAEELELQKHLILSDLLVPNGKADAIVHMIVEDYMADELLIVSHLPCLNLLIGFLAAVNSALAINVRQGGVCCLLAADLRMENRAAIEWLLTPKILLKV